MNEAASATFDSMLIDRVLPLVPGLVERLEVGIAVADDRELLARWPTCTESPRRARGIRWDPVWSSQVERASIAETIE